MKVSALQMQPQAVTGGLRRGLRSGRSQAVCGLKQFQGSLGRLRRCQVVTGGLGQSAAWAVSNGFRVFLGGLTVSGGVRR